ncbi:hypothetical protein [Nonomuraea sp. SBT364]|uniref:hypothetical protein n=1 Tax=Nonomuraea sp. SBT364 TaxID=1580530 RepID=UPI0012E23B91|nr:hypothetical protein [Nonomuraea sp. SBT364]
MKKWVVGAVALLLLWSIGTYVRIERQNRCAPLHSAATKLRAEVTQQITERRTGVNQSHPKSFDELDSQLAELDTQFAETDALWKFWANIVLSDPSCFTEDEVKGAQANLQYKRATIPQIEWRLIAFICFDGWRSPSSGSGTCSHHGGIRSSAWRDSNGREKICVYTRTSRCPYDN